ncbi:uncharacterized protein CIMG_11607 [Coccidioides immitis RS]|uniref:Uncharacterized protein n=1 Tax=Coccidioides immitis (strain RS) TaxID=246410 RepID=A0A0D8JSY0_COCIM|nr:uncharacterized protein CIMG_11607 [Coccidioides immitis RS]KJF60455.1 hypothetical protein CIMG_11607 [Coccidioides immitis RS]
MICGGSRVESEHQYFLDFEDKSAGDAAGSCRKADVVAGRDLVAFQKGDGACSIESWGRERSADLHESSHSIIPRIFGYSDESSEATILE